MRNSTISDARIYSAIRCVCRRLLAEYAFKTYAVKKGLNGFSVFF